MVPRGEARGKKLHWENPVWVTDKQLGGREAEAGSKVASKCMDV